MQRLPASNASSCFAETAVPSGFQQLAGHKQLGGHKRCKSCTNTETDIVVVKVALLQYNYIVAGSQKQLERTIRKVCVSCRASCAARSCSCASCMTPPQQRLTAIDGPHQGRVVLP
jgi:hypothetical protein